MRDINADGIGDLIIGAPWADSNNASPGQGYVVFGRADLGTTGTLELSNLNGINGFEVKGIAAYDRCGFSVNNLDDINADGVTDLIIGAYWADPNGPKSGQSYVVFGDADVGAAGILELSDLNGSNGFKINGIAAGDFSGWSVSGAGDINADGVADFLIGAPRASPNGDDSGQSYVIFGGANIGSAGTMELTDLNGVNGFWLNGAAGVDWSGRSVSTAGDVNGDGVADLIIGAPDADPNNSGSGQSYVVFGGVGVGATGTLELSSLNGVNGFKINGIAAKFGSSGSSVSDLGDINNDGITDLIIGAYGVTPNGSQSGQSYVIFGGASIGDTGTIELSELNGANGFKINGIAAYDKSGSSVSNLGDINVDGAADFIVGAYGANPSGPYSGQSYIVFGGVTPPRLLQNFLSIKQGERLSVTNKMLTLNITNSSELTVPYYHISDNLHSHFENSNNPSVSITSFSQADIDQGKVVFIHDGSEVEPSFNFYIYKSFYRTGPITGNVVFYTYPTLLQNQLTLVEGQTVTFTAEQLQATDVSVPANSLQFSISGLTHGQFVSIEDPSQGITQFQQSRVTQGKIQFIHDGSENSPSYRVSVSNGVLETVPKIATISFTSVNDLPQLVTNNFIIEKQGGTIITDVNLQATDEETLESDLQFIVSDITHGSFQNSLTPDTTIEMFTQQDVSKSEIKFFVDGSGKLPQFNITVSDGAQQTRPVPAQVQFVEKKAIINLSKNDNTTRNVLISTFTTAGLLTGLLMCYISMGFLKKRHMKALTKGKDAEQAQFYRGIIIPVAQAAFKQIKVTGFMNYISANKMEAYVTQIAAIVHELSELGINIELQYMDSERQTQLLNQIIKQMQRHLKIESTRCNKAWFTSFFKPQVTPEMIGEKAQAIAESVYTALLGHDEDENLKQGGVGLMNITDEASDECKFTTGYVQMP